MGLHDKTRLLELGMPAGMPFFECDNRSYIHLRDVPYELEQALLRWLELNPCLVDQCSPDCELIEGPKGLAISQHGWGQFLAFVREAVNDKLAQLANTTAQG